MTPSPLLTGFAGKRGEQALGLWLGVLAEVLVLEHLLCGRPLVRIEGEQGIEQRGAGGGEAGELCADDGARGEGGGGLLLLLGQTQGAGVGQAAKGGPGLVGGEAAQLKDFGYLVDLVGALQEGLAGNELAKDAADGPHVDGGGVGARAEEELRAAVPQGDDELGEFGRWKLADVAGHAKVCDFEEAAVAEEEVGGFEVAVEDVVFVEVGDARGELEEEALDFGGEEGFGHVVEDGFEVVLDEFEDEEDGAGSDELAFVFFLQ